MTDEQRLQMITEQLILVRDNLFRGMSKSIQKLQARSINEVLELPNHTQSPPAQRKPLTIAEVEQILGQHNYEIHGDRARYIVRMTEAAHGIKEKNTP
jgi:uncharacterized membrane protein YgcG